MLQDYFIKTKLQEVIDELSVENLQTLVDEYFLQTNLRSHLYTESDQTAYFFENMAFAQKSFKAGDKVEIQIMRT